MSLVLMAFLYVSTFFGVNSSTVNMPNKQLTSRQVTSSPSKICFNGDVVDHIMTSINNNHCVFQSGVKCHDGKPIDCGDIPKGCPSGIYTVYPKSSVGFKAYCEMKVDHGGWTVFQRRENGDVDFFLGWDDYKNGFGDLNREFWLGNKYINFLTSQARYELRIDLEDFEGNTAYAKYNRFFVGDEKSKYKLSIGGYSGNAGNSLNYQDMMAFSTKDMDNDFSKENCARTTDGAWWFKDCMLSHLNGRYFIRTPNSSWRGVHWDGWKGHDYSLKSSLMMIRRT